MKRLDFVCDDHGVCEVISNSVHDPVKAVCPKCGDEMEVIWFQSAYINPDPYWCGIDTDMGHYTSRRAYYNAIARKGSIVNEPGIDEYGKSLRESMERKEESELEEAISNYVGTEEFEGTHNKINERLAWHERNDRESPVKFKDEEV